MLKSGVAIRDITPPEGLELGGYPHYPRYNTGAHDSLYAACIYLNDGKNETALVTLDLLFFSKKHVQSVRERVNAACGMKPGNIMISCSHTHSGPWAAGRLDIESLEAGVEQPVKYVNSLIEGITSEILEARENAFEASIAIGTAMCGAESGVGGNRRIPGGPHDPLVSVLAVKDKTDRIRGIFVNYTLHPTFIHEWSTVCTADYPCYLKRELTEREPGAVVCFAQGASGNQSSRYYRQGESYDEAERVGRTLGKAAFTVLKKASWKEDAEIECRSTSVPLEIRSFGTVDELKEKVARDTDIYKELYAKYGSSKNRKEYYLWQNANLKMLGSEDQLGYALMKEKGTKIELLEDENPDEVQLIKIGDSLMVNVQGEVFVEYALYIKAMAGYETVFFNELANGCLPGYLYTPESLVTGGYETDTSMLGPSFGRHLVNAALEEIGKLHKETM